MQEITDKYPSINLETLRKEVVHAEFIHSFTDKALEGWSSIPLRSFNGMVGQNASKGSGVHCSADSSNFQDTVVMQPYIKEIVNSISNYVLKVRLMKLKAGAELKPHRDFFKDDGPSVTRIHIPVFTNPQVMFSVGEETKHLEAGHIYTVDVSQTHSVKNKGSEDRIHLILDVSTESLRV